MNIVFLGTGQFAVPILRHIVEKTDWEVGLVVCEAPKEAGRGRKEAFSPVHRLAVEYNLSVYTPKTLKSSDVQGEIAEHNADIYITAAYGKIIPPEIFNAPPHKTVNIHPSLLPEYRGPSPIQWALLEGRQETGVSLMLIDEEMDHGPVLSQEMVPIQPDDTYNTLEARLAEKGAELLVRDIPRYTAGDLPPTPQKHNKATYTNLIQKKDGRVDWQKPAEDIYNRWRAFVRWPGLFTFAERNEEDLRLVLSKLTRTDVTADGAPGMLWNQDKRLFVQCGSGAVEIVEIQPAGKQSMPASAFINGYGDVLDTQLL